MQVCLAGLEDSGKRVLLSLLYGSMIRYSEEKRSGFRFSTSTKHQVVFGENYNNLRGGLWPYKPYPDQISITMRFRELGISAWLKKNIARKEITTQSNINFSIHDVERIKDEDVWEDDIKKLKELPGAKLTLLVFDIPSLKKDTGSLERFEKVFRKTIDWRGSKTKPAVIFTMCDKLKSKKLEKLGIPQGIPDIKKIEERKKVGHALIKEGLPSMNKLLKSYSPEFFFLGIETERDEDDKELPKVNPDIESELEYPYEEYKALIQFIGKFEINNSA
ncbi:MAG: hypothetical protein ACMUIE_09220 [Thermoplasmatota archaeon]